jgi:tRNA A37 N6-isopentenylltransferase MiaA
MKELDRILYNEVMPALRFNMLMLPAPEWQGFEIEWLKRRILKKHRFGRRQPIWFRAYTTLHWSKLRPRIEEARQA